MRENAQRRHRGQLKAIANSGDRIAAIKRRRLEAPLKFLAEARKG
jgi:hypothetical protein